MTYTERAGQPGYWDYDGLPVQADVATHQFVLRYAHAHLPPGTGVLDVAAGHGALSKALLDGGFAVRCTSWDEKVRLAIPTDRVDLDRPFGVADVGGQPFALVCAIEIIEHVENPAAFLRSCRAVLAPGGRLIVSTPNVESAAARLQWFLRGVPSAFSGEEITRNRHISMLWRQGLEFQIGLAGFDILEKHFIGRPRLHGVLQRLVKRSLHWLLEHILLGEPRGSARLYVLGAADRDARRLGPGEVY